MLIDNGKVIDCDECANFENFTPDWESMIDGKLYRRYVHKAIVVISFIEFLYC